MKELFDSAEKIFELLAITEGRREYIRRKLNSAIQLGFIYSSDQVYPYITNWLDTLNVPRVERLALRLDAPKHGTEYNGKPLYSQSAITKETPFDILTRKDDLPRDELSIGEALELLDPNLPKTHTRMLELLLGDSAIGVDSGMTENEVRQNSSKLIDRLEEVTARLYEHRILVPRIALVQFDQGLRIDYTGKLPSEIIQAVLDAYRERISANRVARRYGTSAITVLKIWKGQELEPHYKSRRIPISGVIQSRIREGHAQGLNVVEITRYSGTSPKVVRKYLTLWGLKEVPNENNVGLHRTCNFKDEQIAEIVSAHPTYGGNAWAASRDLPYCAPTIRKYWAGAGLPMVKPGQRRLK